MDRRASLVLIVLVQTTVQFHLEGHFLRPDDGDKTVYLSPFSEFLDPGQDTEIFVVGLTKDLPRQYGFKITPTEIQEESPEVIPVGAVEESPEEILESTVIAPSQNTIATPAINKKVVETNQVDIPLVVVEEVVNSEPISRRPIIVEYFLADLDADRADTRRLDLTGSNDISVSRRRRDVAFVDSQLHEFAPRFRLGKMRT